VDPFTMMLIGTTAATFLDNMFGSGKKSRDQQQQGLDMQRMLAEAQLPDIRRRTELNRWLQEQLQGQFADPQTPEIVDLDGFLQQFLPGKELLPNSLFESVGPGVMRNTAMDKLMGLGGNVGTGGIQGFANLSTGLGESRRGEFSGNISDIVRTLLQSGLLDKQSQYGGYGTGIGPESDLFSRFLTPPGPGGIGDINTSSIDNYIPSFGG